MVIPYPGQPYPLLGGTNPALLGAPPQAQPPSPWGFNGAQPGGNGFDFKTNPLITEMGSALLANNGAFGPAMSAFGQRAPQAMQLAQQQQKDRKRQAALNLALQFYGKADKLSPEQQSLMAEFPDIAMKYLGTKVLPPDRTSLMSVGKGASLYDPNNQSWITPPGGETPNPIGPKTVQTIDEQGAVHIKQWNPQSQAYDIEVGKAPVGGGGLFGGGIDPSVTHKISQAIINGNQPPEMRGLYRYGAAVRADLEAQGFDYSKANLDWVGTSRLLATMNGPQQTRIRQSIGQVKETLPLVRSLADKWEGGNFPLLNKANLRLAKEGLINPEAQSIAVQLDAEISDVITELSTVYMGGNTPTEQAFKLAANQLNSEWSVKTLRDAIDLAETNVKYRENSLRLGTAGVPESQYNQIQSTPLIDPSLGNEPLPGAPQPTTPQVVAPPAAGTIEGGYRFKGGDPANQNNWESVR